MREHRPHLGVHTCWSYRPGQFARTAACASTWRCARPAAADRVWRVWIDTDERSGEVASDHAPVVIDLRP